MNALARHSHLRSLTACVLTLMASGDDFNLMRVLLPAQFVEVSRGSLPLDDENTDFDAQTVEDDCPLRHADGTSLPAPTVGFIESEATPRRHVPWARSSLRDRQLLAYDTKPFDCLPNPNDLPGPLPVTPLRC